MGDEAERYERPEATTATSPSPGLSDDQLYRALASTQRRRVLYLLLDRAESTVDELATVLVGWEATETGTMSGPDDHRRTVVGLVHSDLPLLADVGLVDYDRADGTVRLEPLDGDVTELVLKSVAAEQSTPP
jgi:DNA-binding transcriptional ArsR family regulator